MSKKSGMTSIFDKLTGEARVIDSPQVGEWRIQHQEEDKSGKLYNIMDHEKEELDTWSALGAGASVDDSKTVLTKEIDHGKVESQLSVTRE
jgi:hypothetical protein